MIETPPRSTGGPARWRWRSADRWRWLAPVALGLLGSLAGLVLFTTLHRAPVPVTEAQIEGAVASALAESASAPPRSAEVFQTILPSLVLIRTSGNAERADGIGVGTGVIVNTQGAILTAHHVVDEARAIRVQFADGTEARAEVQEVLPNDLAVLRADGAPEIIVPAVLGGGSRVGDLAFAVGNPLGLTASLSAGVISGLDRSLPARRGAGALSGLIQFDAAVNPGSSGGPLLNREGQVIGIVTALASPSGGDGSFTGIGFAVPLGTAGGGGGPPR